MPPSSSISKLPLKPTLMPLQALSNNCTACFIALLTPVLEWKKLAMKAFANPQGLSTAFLYGFILLASAASTAESTVEVNLEAAFEKPPFLLELLESAASENSSAYFPLLRDIALGHFDFCLVDEEFYYTFLSTLKDNEYITDEAVLATWNFGLSIHEAAPRIEAQHQLWASTVYSSYHGDATPSSNAVEVWTDGNGLCIDERCEGQGVWYPPTNKALDNLPFDRVRGPADGQSPWTLYIDITDRAFGDLYLSWSERLIRNNIPFRVRYKPSMKASTAPLVVSGYGVELALKRTDYIVIDDRAEEEAGNAPQKKIKVNLESKNVADVKPLSTTELKNLGLNTASFIMKEKNPLATLLKISGDFPKHAAALASHNASSHFITEHRANRASFVPAGYNIVWINGASVDSREFDAYSLIERLRGERNLVNSLISLGLSAPEAISLLSHEAIADASSTDEPQRYDFRDEAEGGEVIIWMNDIEKDKRYADFPTNNKALLQRVFPGQLPSVRKDIHNVIFPVDLSDRQDVLTVLETIQAFVKKLVPVRFGLVPLSGTPVAVEHAMILYYLVDTYGLAAAMDYLDKSLPGAKANPPSGVIFAEVVEDRKARLDRHLMSFGEILQSDALRQRIQSSKSYLKRLGSDGSTSPIFGNGIALPKNDEWMQAMSQRLALDLRTIQQNIFEENVEEGDWLPGIYLKDAAFSRNSLIIPEDEQKILLFDLVRLHADHFPLFRDVPVFRPLMDEPAAEETTILLFGDLNNDANAELILSAILFSLDHDMTSITLLHHPDTDFSISSMTLLQEKLSRDDSGFGSDQKEKVGRFLTGALMSQSVILSKRAAELRSLSNTLSMKPSDTAVMINGRLLLLSDGTSLSSEDFNTLYNYERKKRIDPVDSAIQDLKLSSKLTGDLPLAKLSSLIALSSVSDIPQGIFDTASGPRTDAFKIWNSTFTSIEYGDKATAPIQVVASIDPSSELAQRWIPIIMVLAEMKGVHLHIFLNPKERLSELPTKRFYRHVLHAQPAFYLRGGLADPNALFSGLPKDALLTMALDVPPAWLVAAKDAAQDLDNIKLSSLKDGAKVEAKYELENILIEGHSRDETMGSPPRGVQFVLGSGDNPDFASTIVMANLGYFQFKANPGLYNLALQSGASEEIFSLDSAGTLGHSSKQGDETTRIALSSFKGATLFPRLSRKPGMEEYDVLETPQISTSDIAAKAARLADGVLDKVGVTGVRTGELFSQALNYGRMMLGKSGIDTTSLNVERKHADINIFSVASGHLYERMLNIMMVSVMRHTDKTVKFWFIEQFLSPSFKKSMPTLAKEYGFEYEMVTYKWPHWLRAQKEKQRVIWGYKILFLDVLFPLDLDKVIFVDADQIVRTDMYDLVQHDLGGAPYGFTPMCDSRTEMEGFRFWKQGYWKQFLQGLPYHISALYVVDLKRFRQMAAGDRLRQQYHQLSADPNSLSNLDQDLPNHMQSMLPIHSLPQEWLWCETWCSDEALKEARTIDLCNNPQTKEPKLDRARRQVPEWTTYDDEIAAVFRGEGRPSGNKDDGPPPNHVSSEASIAEPQPEASANPEVHEEL
ncbi:hypothetical protein FH972_022883 [Carpinus fangiana]|uniref:UDP-glucose:glycoprotein glucosyltransferase n=1 Tax=Carpinus fangiana TaxID=176857 RepID=A0A5N6KU75_9ROSI|nr:hypothetical protein FH972_022883 [Carpinus fangiana]